VRDELRAIAGDFEALRWLVSSRHTAVPLAASRMTATNETTY
jgi:hypothetical protein